MDARWELAGCLPESKTSGGATGCFQAVSNLQCPHHILAQKQGGSMSVLNFQGETRGFKLKCPVQLLSREARNHFFLENSQFLNIGDNRPCPPKLKDTHRHRAAFISLVQL